MKRVRLTSKIAAAQAVADKKKKENRNGEDTRNLDGFEYDTSKARVLKKALHNINVSLGTLISAMKELSILRGSEITPDGKLGGRGFIMGFRDLKSKLNNAVTDLSDVTDTIADELTNPKWGLSPSERKKVKQDVEEIEEEVEKVEEVTPEGEAPEEETPGGEAPQPPEVGPEEEISPEDVIDSSDIEALKRYESLIDGNVKDKVASVLSKQIVANLTKGE